MPPLFEARCAGSLPAQVMTRLTFAGGNQGFVSAAKGAYPPVPFDVLDKNV